MSSGLYRVRSDYQYVRYQYYIGISVWEGLFDKYNVDFCIINGLIHGITYDYLMFAVAKNRNIPGFMLFDFGIGYRTMMTMYHEWGNKLIDIPENARDNSIGNIVRQDAYYSSQTIGVDGNKSVVRGLISKFCHRYFGLGPELFWNCLKNRSFYFEWYKGRRIKTYLPNFFYEMWMWKYIIRQNKKSYMHPDYNKKYIIYFMHMEPEATMVHYATNMDSQLIAIKMLVSSLPENWEVYVKEHPDTHSLNHAGWSHFIEFYKSYNSIWYWKQLRDTSRVRFIDVSESATKLIRMSQAVATFSGTVIEECLNEEKPCLIFGDSRKIVYSQIQGMYTVSSYADCCLALKNISCGKWDGYVDIDKTLSKYIVRNDIAGYKLFLKLVEDDIFYKVGTKNEY